jgi:hypothetical protein
LRLCKSSAKKSQPFDYSTLATSTDRFLEEYVLAPKHPELLRTRESKRENGAFDRGEYLDCDEDLQRRA